MFDIQQGVAIIIAVKKKVGASAEKKLASLFHGELWGDRKCKYDALWKSGAKSASVNALPNRATQYPFVARDFSLDAVYQQGFGVQELMPVNSVGIVTARDALTIDMDKDALWKRVEDFTKLDVETLRTKYVLGKDVRDWSVQWAKKDVIDNYSPDNLVPIAYRPFDKRWTYYTGNSRGFQCYPRGETTHHMLSNQNLCVELTRTIEGGRDFTDILVFDAPVTHHSMTIKEVNSFYPLYLYPSENDLDQTRRVNMDPKIRRAIEDAAMGKRPTELAPTSPLAGEDVGAGSSQSEAQEKNRRQERGNVSTSAKSPLSVAEGGDISPSRGEIKEGVSLFLHGEEPRSGVSNHGGNAPRSALEPSSFETRRSGAPQDEGLGGSAVQDEALESTILPPSPLWGGIEGGGKAAVAVVGVTPTQTGASHASRPSFGPPQGGGGQIGSRPDEVAIFDYIYGVLHCPQYRETYREFLKIDFPRVPYPPSPDIFWDVSAKGTSLRKLHLMEDAAIGAAPYKFTGDGDSVVGKVKYEGGRVFINEAQGFDNVPEIAWNFYIGGYQPAQKWLKDRKGRELAFDDIKHYQKIIKILSETDRIMKTIEMPLG